MPLARLRRSCILALFSLLTTRLAPASATEECDGPTWCSTSPCTIVGRHLVEDGCVLDFTGMDVTIAPGASIYQSKPSTFDFPSMQILARNLTVKGAIGAAGGSLAVAVDEDLVIEAGAGPGRIALGGVQARNYFVACIDLSAGGTARLAGSLISSEGTCGISVEGSAIEVDGPIRADNTLLGPSAYVSLFTSDGPITVNAPITVTGLPGDDDYTGVFMTSGGDISVSAPLTALDKFGIQPLYGAIFLSSQGKIAVSSALKADSSVDLDALGDIEVGAPIWVRNGAASDLELRSENGSVMVTKRILAESVGPDSGVTVDIEAAELARIEADLIANARGSEGTAFVSIEGKQLRVGGRVTSRSTEESFNTLSFTDSADLTGARFEARQKVPSPYFPSGNLLLCPCADMMCAAGCLAPPLGFDPAAAKPPFVISPR